MINNDLVGNKLYNLVLSAFLEFTLPLYNYVLISDAYAYTFINFLAACILPGMVALSWRTIYGLVALVIIYGYRRFIRRIFWLSVSKTIRNTIKKVVFIVFLGYLFMIIIIFISHYIVDKTLLAYACHNPRNMAVSWLLWAAFFIVNGDVVARLLQSHFNAEKILRDSEAKYRNIFENIQDMYFEVQIDGTILEMSPSIENILGYTADEVIGSNIIQIYAFPEERQSLLNLIKEKGRLINYEVKVKKKDNSLCYLSYNLKTVTANNEITKIIGLARDITDSKKALEEIEILNKDLEKRVEERTLHLQSALAELEAFNYTVSHDLKSPLRSIEGYCRFILEEYEQELQSEVRRMTANIGKISNDMIELINKLLNFSTTDKLEIAKENVDIEELFYLTFNEMKASCSDRNIVLTIEGEIPSVEGDKVLLKQAISNIYSNSFKFTRHKERAAITIGCKQCEEGYLFSIQDDGIGFDMEYAENIFGMFQRLHSQKEFEGDGIGLPTVRKIIQKHGGRVWIEGEVNKGATVCFILPFTRENAKECDLEGDK